MAARLRSRLTFANVCSFLALTIALGTGGAYAANTVGSDDIIDEQMDLLRRYYPEAADARVVHGHVVKMPKATFSQVSLGCRVATTRSTGS